MRRVDDSIYEAFVILSCLLGITCGWLFWQRFGLWAAVAIAPAVLACAFLLFVMIFGRLIISLDRSGKPTDPPSRPPSAGERNE